MQNDTGRTNISCREKYPLGAARTRKRLIFRQKASDIICRCIFHLKCKYLNFIFFNKKVCNEVVIKLLTPISKSLILTMFKKFQIHLLDNFPHLKNQKILLALSGGLDSCVLLSLCLKQGLNISIAHCNFQLREKIVRKMNYGLKN